MDPKALFNISYGIFMLSSRGNDGKVNGCITNTCIQVASNPTRVAIACINGNLTCDMVKQSGIFCLSILDHSTKFDTIKRFGMQSGRDVDKFADLKCPTDAKGLPYLDFQTCSVISCHVVSQQDLGSHTLFIAEIDDAVRTAGAARSADSSTAKAPSFLPTTSARSADIRPRISNRSTINQTQKPDYILDYSAKCFILNVAF